MKVWITKYALTEGIFTADVEYRGDDTVRDDGNGSVTSLATYYHGEGKEWHRSEVEAIQRAQEMRDKKIGSLKKQLEKLEKMKF